MRASGGSTVFEVTYLPARPANLGVVICSSILVEQLTNYRPEVLLARGLAARGFAVQRFHYRGTGLSGGENTDATWETMCEDAAAATERLRSRAHVDGVAFIGARWGAAVAAAVARSYPAGPLVLWEPVLDGKRYFREMIRARLVREVKDRRFAGATDLWKTELAERGWVDLLGYTLHRALYESGQGVDLEALLAGRRSSVLLIQFGRATTLRADYRQLQTSLSRQGASVDVRVLHEEPAWFFPGYVLTSVGDLVGTVGSWLEAPATRNGTSA